jgi:hypothetical protein
LSKFENREDLAGKISWEGGIDMALDYGIIWQDMPDKELEDAWYSMQQAYENFEHYRDIVEDLMPEDFQELM